MSLKIAEAELLVAIEKAMDLGGDNEDKHVAFDNAVMEFVKAVSPDVHAKIDRLREGFWYA